jgi:hypothetical protein
MPFVIKSKNGTYLTKKGHPDISVQNAWRFNRKMDAEKIANALGFLVVSDVVRLGIDRACAIHKGPAGDCKPWNCVCY